MNNLYGSTASRAEPSGSDMDRVWTEERQRLLRSILIVYCTLMLDNVLLTVVVPILPIYLDQMEHIQEVTRTLSMGSSSSEGTTSSSSSRVGDLLSSKAFVQLLFNPLVGVATHRWGYRRPLIFGTATLLVSALVFASCSTFWWLLLARSLQGVASAFITVAGMGMVAKMYGDDEEERSRVMGYVLGSIAAGALIGYPMGGLLFDFVGESSPFVVISLCVLLVLWSQVAGLEDDHDDLTTPVPLRGVIVKTTEDQQEAASQEEGPNDCWRILLKHPSVAVIVGSVFFSTGTMAILEPCLPVWLMDTIKPQKWQLGTAFLPDSFGYLIGTNCFAVTALKLGRHRLAMTAMILLGISCMSVPLSTSMTGLILPHFGLGLGLGMVDSALMPLLAKLVDDEKQVAAGPRTTTTKAAYGIVYSISQTAVSLAYGLGPLLGGHLATLEGFPTVMRTMAFMNFCYSPLLMYLSPEFRRLPFLQQVDQKPPYDELHQED